MAFKTIVSHAKAHDDVVLHFFKILFFIFYWVYGQGKGEVGWEGANVFIRLSIPDTRFRGRWRTVCVYLSYFLRVTNDVPSPSSAGG